MTQVEYLSTVIRNFGLPFTTTEEIIDVSLLCLSIISYTVIKRKDLMEKLDLMLLQYIPFLLLN